jgi:hypothetical protein
MTKQTSIALHLARVMGRPYKERYHDVDGDNNHITFDPFNDLSQWAECVLWAAMNGLEPLIMRTTASAWSDAEIKEISVGACSTEGIQAATLEAIARATSWEESK